MSSDRSRFLVPFTLAALAGMVALGPSCAIRDTVLHPTFPNGGLLATATPVPAGALAHLEGMYRVRDSRVLGTDPVAVHTTRDTVSIFAAPNAAYAILHSGCLQAGTELVLEGYWRYPAATSTGLVRLLVGPPALAAAVCSGDFTTLPSPPPPPTLEGMTGSGAGEPNVTAAIDFDHALKATQNRFVVVGHHGACATTDDCGASENSLESIKMVESFGGSVAELDVHLTADGIPILFHDDDFGARLTNGPFCHGPVDKFTLANVRADCTLKFGEPIPTLEEALATVIDDTALRGVWLDVKLAAAIAPTVRIVEAYAATATRKKRRVNIVTGIADGDSLAAYTGLTPPPAPGTLCLAELTPADVRSSGCAIWAPDWTLGPSAGDVSSLQAEGRAVVFWTMDEQRFIDLYLTSTTPNGIVTNRPGLVFQRFQTLGTLPSDRAQL